jgi:hypothetical protein
MCSMKSRRIIISIVLLLTIILMATDLAGSQTSFVGDPAACAWSDDREIDLAASDASQFNPF